MLLYYSAGISTYTFIIIHLEPRYIWAYPLNMSVLFHLFSMSPNKGKWSKDLLEPESLEEIQEPSIGHSQVGEVLR